MTNVLNGKKIRLRVPDSDVIMGKQLSFIAPCGCNNATSILINGVEYDIVDSMCASIAGLEDKWVSGAIVSVIIDTEKHRAFLLNTTSAAATTHGHDASDIKSGTFSQARIPVIPVTKGGTGANTGSAGLKNLLASGSMVLSSYQYGDTLPAAGTAGRLFFKKVSS